MRIRKLSLIRYGHFEDAGLAFPPAQHDIHLVFGENEAGKSTALRALGDVLFGIPTRTTMDFRFPKPKLRIGATLELGQETFEFVRFKKRLDSIKDADGNDILDGEKTLRRFLAGADRDLFERLFLLNHERLLAGSQALLAGRGDAGEAMLASSAGLEGLHGVLTSLSREADDLWTPAASKKRKYYIAKSALDEAVKARRDNTVEPREWKRARKALEEAREAYESMVREQRDKRAERRRLDRIRRLHGDLSKLASAENELADLGELVLLDENAGELLQSSRTGFKLIQGPIEAHEARIKELLGGIEELEIDEKLLSMAADIDALNERRVALKQHREDLPRRKVARKTLQERIGALARDLSWTAENENAIADKLPTKPLIGRARSLVTDHTRLTTERDGLARQQREAERQKRRHASALKEAPEVVDLGDLVAAVQTAERQRGQLAERRRLEADVDKRAALLESVMKGMAPAFETETQLAGAMLPHREAISTHRDAYLACGSTLKDLRDAARRLAREATAEQNEIEKRRDHIGAMSEADLQRARATRDDAWDLLVARYLRDESVDQARWEGSFAEDEVGDTRYPELVAIADEGADTRFKHAHDVGALANRDRALQQLEERLAGIDEDIVAEETSRHKLDEEWTALWESCAVTPSDPDAGVAWLDQALRCKTLLDELIETRAALEAARRNEVAARDALGESLTRFVAEEMKLADRDIEILIELGNETVRQLRSANDATTAAQDDLEASEEALGDANEELARKDEALSVWQEEWKEMLVSLGLDVGTTPGALASYLGVIEELRENIKELVGNVDDRIKKMESDIDGYESAVRELVAAVGRERKDATIDAFMNALVVSLHESQANDDRRKRDESTIEVEEKKLDELRQKQSEHLEVIGRLAELAGTEDDDALTRAASASDRRRELEVEIEILVSAIEKNGDGKSLAELRAESEGSDLDATVARIEQLEEEIAVLEAEFPVRRDALTTAESELAGIGEHGEAARSEWERQQALADLGDVAERFVRAATASALLRWSIDRFRIQNQKPLLDRASSLFALITRGSFERVVIEYEDDQPVLAGRRPDGEVTSLDGMSSGSRDQLFLALRLAAVEEYAAKASAMPFVGDDLFIQHDKTRTREALTALTQLSKTCQVILFSLDEGFVRVARDVLPQHANIIDIESTARA